MQETFSQTEEEILKLIKYKKNEFRKQDRIIKRIIT